MRKCRHEEMVAVAKKEKEGGDFIPRGPEYFFILTTRSNCMLQNMKPGPLLLTGFLGIWLPMIIRGVLPRKQCLHLVGLIL